MEGGYGNPPRERTGEPSVYRSHFCQIFTKFVFFFLLIYRYLITSFSLTNFVACYCSIWICTSKEYYLWGLMLTSKIGLLKVKLCVCVCGRGGGRCVTLKNGISWWDFDCTWCTPFGFYHPCTCTIWYSRLLWDFLEGAAHVKMEIESFFGQFEIVCQDLQNVESSIFLAKANSWRA